MIKCHLSRLMGERKLKIADVARETGLHRNTVTLLYDETAARVELDAIAAVVIGGTLLTGGYGFIAGTFIGVMLQGLVQTYIVFDGTLSSWWTKIVVGVLLFMFILLQRLVFRAGSRRT